MFIAKPDPTSLLIIGLILCLISALLVFGRKLRFPLFIGLFAATIAIPLAATLFVLELPIDLRWITFAAVVSTILATVLYSSKLAKVFSRSGSLLKRPIISGGIVFVSGIAVIAYACVESEPPADDAAFFHGIEAEEARDYQAAEGLHASTDLGNDIPMMRLTNARAEAIVRSDERISQNQTNRDYLIRVAEPSAQTNCHGWVFTGGLCWVTNSSVEVILAENGYQQVELPAAGDLVVYRDELGKVIHTGIVRAIWSEGRILVESKWGTLGAFVHFVERSVYAGHWTFHHTQRPSHVLRGLPESSGLTSAVNSKGL